MSKDGITADQIVAEISRLAARRPESDGGMTAPELQRALQLGPSKTRVLLQAACLDGIMTCRRAPRPNVLGEMQRVAVYFPAKKPAKAK